MEFRARGAMTVAGIDIAGALISHAGAEASVLIPPGARAEAGDLLLSASGPAAALHLSWKAAQTLTEILSGIATATRALVDAVEAVNPDVKVACSRKTVPLTRQLSAMAVRAAPSPTAWGSTKRSSSSPSTRSFCRCRTSADGGEAAARRQRQLGIEVATVAEARRRSRQASASCGSQIQAPMCPPLPLSRASTARSSPQQVASAPPNAGEFVKAGAGFDRFVLACGQARRCRGEHCAWRWTLKPGSVLRDRGEVPPHSVSLPEGERGRRNCPRTLVLGRSLLSLSPWGEGRGERVLRRFR